MSTTNASAALAQTELETAHRHMLQAVETVAYDTPERAARRIEIIFGLYDDDPGETAQALADLVTDVMHECRRRGVEFDQVAARAASMTDMEIADWEARS